MNRARKVAAAWSELAADQLAEQVRLMVKARDAGARAVWGAVAEDQVLVARVRGALSALKAEFRGHRDEVMWLLWINQAQQHLVVETAPAAPVAEHDVVADLDPVLGLDEDVAEDVVALPVQEPVAAARVVRDVPVMVFQEPSA
ncbi:hypothetical protein AB0A74_15905 [Saccharothrix sp. NPDC042600]|uniref:hypothetical protein n=1 Tax=Saccharothrix TaxID=2071 RepID=UPI003405F665|nr:hypothetical protein GCM10017745_44280 [Saccharothrix mutabilis subsp. capreolus]